MNNFPNVSGKRLLVLGGSNSTVDIVRTAKKMGIYVIVADQNETGPAKEIADEAVMISTADIDNLVKFSQEQWIDGVFTGPSEFNISNAISVCERLNLPFYCTREQWDVFTDKTRFKQVCKKYDIPVIEEFLIRNDFSTDDFDKIKFPVIVKPAQSSGSRGISVCNNEIELRKGIQKASGSSRNAEILVEKYIIGENIGVYINVQNGFVSLSAIADKFMLNFNDGTSPKPVAHIFPSKRLGDYYQKLHLKIVKLCEELNIQNGRMGLLTIFVDNEFYVVEPSYRLIGTREFVIVAHENKINHLEMLINYSLTGTFEGYDVKRYDNPQFDRKYCVLTMLSKDGKISKICGLEKIRNLPKVIDVHVYYSNGDEIKAKGTIDIAFARIYIVGNSFTDLITSINTVQNSLVVLNDKNENMLLGGFDADQLKSHYLA